MKKTFISLMLLVVCIHTTKAQDLKTIISKAISVLSSSNAYAYDFESNERIEGEMIHSGMKVKLMQNPHKIYINNVAGKNKGKELLYIKGENKNKVLVNVAWGFSLSPFSSLIRKGNHHIVLDSGFKSVKAILSNAKKRAEDAGRFDDVFSYAGTVSFDGKTCHKVVINDPTFTYTSYTLKNGESLYQLAKRENLNEQLIIEKNNSLSSWDSAKDGLTIQVPSSYAKKSIIYIDAENYHTIYQELYDEKGLFEKYQFKQLKINPSFTSDEFTKDYKDYNF